MKTVYHGTTIDRANKIIEEGSLEVTNEMNRRYQNTRTGFLYVTSVFQNALEFSVRPSINENNDWFAVFKFDIDDSELKIDEDENKWRSYLYKTDKPCFYTISRSINIISDNVKWYIGSNNYKQYNGDFIDYLNYLVNSIKESEWNKWQG